MKGNFPIPDVLSVVNDMILPGSEIKGIYNVISFTLGEPAFTHTLPEQIKRAREEIIKQHPYITGSSFDSSEIPINELSDWMLFHIDTYGSEIGLIGK